MEFMGFHIVDIVIVSLIAFLAIKGLVNGFSKELFSFLSIVGGVLLAARYNIKAVQFINDQNLVPTIPDEFASLIGFVLIVVFTWIVVGLLSSVINSLTSNNVGYFSRLLGYILAAGRYLFVFSLIIFGVSQSDFFNKSATKFKEETKLFAPMSEIGAKFLNIDVNQTKDANSTTMLQKVMDTNLSAKISSTLTEQNTSN